MSTASLDTQPRLPRPIAAADPPLPADVVNFQAYVQPFPNYYVLAPNIRYYLDHGVRGMYEEGNGEQQTIKTRRSTDAALVLV